MLRAVRLDGFRQCGNSTWKSILIAFLTRRTFRVVVTMRLCQAANAKGGFYKLALYPLMVAHKITSQLAGVDFPWRTKVGEGFALTHGWGFVVNEKSIVGRNVTIFQGVTIGQRDKIKPGGHRETYFPVIEDDVWIGPNAIIVGGVTVGRGSRIAGGAFVVHDVPPYSLVVGNPASVIKSNCVPDVSNRVSD